MTIDYTSEFGYEALFNPAYVEYLVGEYGQETEIKIKCDTPCKMYEIRTAIRYWGDGSMSHRTSDAFATRLYHYEHGDMTVEEAMRL